MRDFRLFLLWALTSLTARAQSYSFSTFAGQPGVTGHGDGPAATAMFQQPSGLAIDAAGNLFVAATGNLAVRKIAGGTVSTVASVSERWAASMFGTPGPQGLALDSSGTLYESDVGNHIINKVLADGTLQFFAGTSRSVDMHGLYWSFELPMPASIRFDRAGNLLTTAVTKLQSISPAGVVTDVGGALGTGIAQAKIGRLQDFVVDATGTLFLTDPARHVIWKATSSGAVTVLAGLADVAGTTDGTGTDARFGTVAGIAIDPAGNLVVTDNSALRLITPAGKVTTIAGSPNELGTADGVGGVARFNAPSGIAFDAAGNIYIADSGNNTIRKGVPTSQLSVPIVTTPASSQNQDVGARANVTFTVAAAGQGLTYQWLHNGTVITAATAATLSLPEVNSGAEGTYTAVVANTAGTISTLLGTLHVYTPTLSTFSSRHSVAGGSFLWSIASSPDLLVTVGDHGAILTSADGVNWTRCNSGTTDWLVGVTYGGGQFVAVGDRGRVLVSVDGTSWRSVTQPATTQRLNNVGYADGLYVAVGEAGTIITSPDALTWTARNSGVTGWLHGLACQPGRFYYRYVATGQGGTAVASTDGIDWIQYGPFNYSNYLPSFESGRFSDDLEGLTVLGTNGEYLSVGANGAAVSFYPFINLLPNGTADLTVQILPRWSVYRTGAPVILRGLAIGADAMFALGENGTILGAQSIRGPWSTLPSGTTANLVAGTFFHDALFAVGENETILQSDPVLSGRLANISTRGLAGNDTDMMTAGFVIRGSSPKRILLRAAGPALNGFGVSGTIAQPVLTLLNAAGQVVAANARWETGGNASAISTAAAGVGAFPFAAGNADSALLVPLAPGAYTAQVTSANGTSGVGLVEVYDTDANTNTGPRAINISTRGQAGGGDRALIAGFVIDGISARRVLIRVVGPTLGQFGVSGALAKPTYQVKDRRGYIQADISPGYRWPDADTVRQAAESAGAFALPDRSDDAAAVLTLLPGAWTVQVSSGDNSSGAALVEVYELP